jgi:hypothetical protein
MKKKISIKEKLQRILEKKYPEFSIYINDVRRKRNAKSTYLMYLGMNHKKSGWGGYLDDYEYTF